ncbi:MAG TPA: hypothetical protein VMI54_06185 [Polyangiaceae bacterium]|nr:hypothetical protein [Polyangiaceae bacterium]
MSSLRTALRAFVVGVVGLAFFACGSSKLTPQTGSETHFLTACMQSCDSGAECVCGACTLSCSEDADCAELGSTAACVSLAPRVAEGRCDAGDAPSACDVSCLVASDCAGLGTGYACDAGYCRLGTPPAPMSEPASCTVSEVAGSSIAIIGDSLIQLSPFTADFEQAAVAAGVLADGDQVRDYSSYLNSVLAGGGFGIMNQWTTARGDGPVHLVIMDGGATDVLNAPCGATPATDCPAILAAAAGAENLLAAYADFGVSQVIYAFYSDPSDDPTNASLEASLDVMRPYIENACGRAAIPCYFLDLRPTFTDHPEYLGPDGIVWSSAGAAVAASDVLGVLLDRCAAW